MKRLLCSWFGVLCCTVWMGVGCAEGEVTSLVVTIESDLPKDALDEARVSASGSAGSSEVARADLDDQGLPRVVTVLPGDDDLETPVLLRASGWLDGNEVLSQSREVYFDEGRARRITMTLSEECLDVECPEGESCVDGACVEANAGDAGVDAGPEEYCTVDGQPRDCSGMDGTCLVGECDAEAEACVAVPAADGDPCDSDGICNAGVCERSVDCSGGSCSCDSGLCEIDCGGGGSCSPNCNGDAICNIDCTDVGNCSKVRCRGNAACTLNCQGSSNCGFQQCSGGEQSCPNDIVLCGVDACP